MLKEIVNENRDLTRVLAFEWEEEGVSIGNALFFTMGRTAALQNIEIKEEFRGMGIGTMFMADILFELRDRGYSIAAFSIVPSDYPALYKVAKKLHMVILERKAAYYKFTLADLERLDCAKVSLDGLKSLNKATDEELKTLANLIAESEDAPMSSPVFSDKLEKELSLFHVNEGTIDGAVFMDKYEDHIYLSFLWIDSEDANLIRNLLTAVYHLGVKKYGKDTAIEVAVVNEKVDGLLKILVPDKGERAVKALADLTILDDFYDDEEDSDFFA
jgi:predicted GNAT family acetyltransferase